MRPRAAARAGVAASDLESVAEFADAAVRGGAVEFSLVRSVLVATGGRPVLDALVGSPARLLAHRCGEATRVGPAGRLDAGMWSAAAWPVVHRAVGLLRDVVPWRPLAPLLPGTGQGRDRGSVVVRAALLWRD